MSMTPSEKITAAAEWLHAEMPAELTMTIDADVLRTMSPGRAYVQRYNGGGYVAGIAGPGRFLEPTSGPRKARITIRAPRTDAERDDLLREMVDAVRTKHPPGSSYDPAMRPQYERWGSLLTALTE